MWPRFDTKLTTETLKLLATEIKLLIGETELKMMSAKSYKLNKYMKMPLMGLWQKNQTSISFSLTKQKSKLLKSSYQEGSSKLLTNKGRVNNQI